MLKKWKNSKQKYQISISYNAGLTVQCIVELRPFKIGQSLERVPSESLTNLGCWWLYYRSSTSSE